MRYTGNQFRFDVVTKTKPPVCERHPATRDGEDFVRLGELVRVLERVVAGDCFCLAMAVGNVPTARMPAPVRPGTGNRQGRS